MKVLIVCTGNSCRSQMAEAIIRLFHPHVDVLSAGTNPEKEVNPYAVEVMKEIGIDISHQFPKSVEKFIHESFDYVITVCDSAKEKCPVIQGKIRKRLHIGFPDPAEATGSHEEILHIYRSVRDDIIKTFKEFRFE
ncbi:MAG: arsenate reductase ArsC [Bacteroidales bacterium]|nr:arsenate reductase ArsC [Bacteroidales bacterium]